MKTKTGLSELRMLMLGSQILLGFQFRGTFAELFVGLPGPLKAAQGLALVAMSLEIGLLLTPGNFHRLAERGQNTKRLEKLISRVATWTPWPLGLALALNIGIVVGHVRGLAIGAAAGGGFGLAAVTAWWVVGAVKRRKHGAKERAMAERRTPKPTPPEEKIEEMLTEARIILPGAQALLGFQFLVVLTRSFEALDPDLKLVHLSALGLIAVAVILLMTPATYHRLVYGGEENESFYRVGSALITWASLPFGLGLTADLYVTMMHITNHRPLSVGFAVALFLCFVGFWYVYPWLVRRRQGKESA